MVQAQSQKSKAVSRLKQLVGYECVVSMRSVPEVAITGVLDSFDLDCVPSLIVVDSDNGLRVINFQDVSVIKEIKPR